MGAYGTGSFDNDKAQDFYFGEFLQDPTKELLYFYLQHPLLLTDSGIASRTIAAAEIMALYKERIYEDSDQKELHLLFEKHPLNLGKEDYLVATEAIKEIATRSTLETAWRTVYSDSYNSWKANLDILQERLQTF